MVQQLKNPTATWMAAMAHPGTSICHRGCSQKKKQQQQKKKTTTTTAIKQKQTF